MYLKLLDLQVFIDYVKLVFLVLLYPYITNITLVLYLSLDSSQNSIFFSLYILKNIYFINTVALLILHYKKLKQKLPDYLYVNQIHWQ